MLIIYNNEKNRQRLFEEVKKGNHLCVYYEEVNNNCIYAVNGTLYSKYNCAVAITLSEDNFYKILATYYYDVSEFYVYGNDLSKSILVFEIIK